MKLIWLWEVGSVEISVLPPYAHAYNPAENAIRLATRNCRKNLENVVGTNIGGKRLTRDDATKLWPWAYEKGIQMSNISPNQTLTRRYSLGTTPMQVMTGDFATQLDFKNFHPFGELC